MHTWTVHAKKEITHHLRYFNGGTKDEELTIEILICDKCGKIKQIEY